jgi:hypothetical protein
MKMRTLLYAGVATSALLAAAQASADVFVEADITKHKDITVTENITISKTIDITAVVAVIPTKAAEATGIINQVNQDNEACGNCAEKRDAIIGSIGGGEANTGIVNVNQSSGNMNNQGNAVSVAVDVDDPNPPSNPPPILPPPPSENPPTIDPNGGFANSQAHVEQVNGQEDGEGPGGNLVDTVNLLFRDAVIENSINGNRGIVNVNQSPGSMNNQANLISVAVSLRAGGVALSEADLGQVNSANDVHESDTSPVSGDDFHIGINKSASITGSINGNAGIIGVNQASGNMANQANNVSAAAVVVPSL